MNFNNCLAAIFTIALSSAASLSAQSQVDENALFSDSSSVVDSAKVVNTAGAVKGLEEKKTVGFSGEIFAYADPSVKRQWFDGPNTHDVAFDSRIVGNGLLDVRLVGGAKAFADMEASYTPGKSLVPLSTQSLLAPDSGAQFFLREFFVDANYHKLAYLRAGKQVLQWGPCYFWNPTDLVNVEHKSFLQKMGHREGAYGLKLHVPYKTLFNFYSFIDAGDAPSADRLAASVKAEVLIGRTEMALSAWDCRGKKPVLGFDCTSRLFDFQVALEVSVRNGSDMLSLAKKNGVWDTTTLGDSWLPRACLDLTRFFPLGGVADRLTVTGEFYYNHAGYDVNVFNDPVLGKDLSQLFTGTITPSLITDFASMPWLRDSTVVPKLYEPHSYSKYYAALFISISRFILDDMTFSFNTIGNLSQGCFVVSTGVDYQSLHNFVCGISLNAFVGPPRTEYTFTGNGLAVQARIGVVF
jgi:hypothetical protein